MPFNYSVGLSRCLTIDFNHFNETCWCKRSTKMQTVFFSVKHLWFASRKNSILMYFWHAYEVIAGIFVSRLQKKREIPFMTFKILLRWFFSCNFWSVLFTIFTLQITITAALPRFDANYFHATNWPWRIQYQVKPKCGENLYVEREREIEIDNTSLHHIL